MRAVEPIKPPTRRELFTLRLMIILGLACMFFFMRGLFDTKIVEFEALYWLLMVAMAFTCLKVLHEWVHYFYITVPPSRVPAKNYTVDILTTFVAGEPYDMIIETLTAIQQITYPHQTYLCDEADDAYLKDICKQLGVIHVTRTKKIDAKAGNINNALKQATGELCVILDPDHVPSPDFLDPIVGHFNDPDVGFVQIVQAYSNHYHGLVAKGAAQQTFQFYGPIMMGMNKFGTVLAIGANCTFRREALDSIGGHAAGLAEDMHTAMQLHARGWKSLYVPAILARGLVPFTLSAYYKQQLKWSRGVFELLFTSYIKLFTKFTWKQKLHYGVLPFHYLSGLLFLINFLIPIISLTFDISPVNIALSKFALIGFPFVLAIILIRHFVQWWVTEDEERGFHVVGGLLMIGTWWVFMMGLICTIIRRNIPYIPTDKDGKEADNFLINIPNIVVIVLSLAAIVFGLYRDWSPYTLIMAGFALMNCGILLFSVMASRQHQFREWRGRVNLMNRLMLGVSEIKGRFWLLRRRIYTGIRSTALLITILLVCVVLYILKEKRVRYDEPLQKQYALGTMQAGIFAPVQANGLSNVNMVKQYEQQGGMHFGIISLYVPWGDEKQCDVPVKLVDSIYRRSSIPMITWEPWQSLFVQNQSINVADKEKKVFARILAGDYDAYLSRFCRQIKDLKRPVYLRFAHETDNPFYPWSVTGGNTPSEFKAAWVYVHNYFQINHADNAIWVWNPWKPGTVDSYFPGEAYVDWLGVTNLNYGLHNGNHKWYSMEQLYAPFHDNAIFTSGLPVMLAETGSLKTEGRQDDWFKNAVSAIHTKFPEIKAVVLFNSGIDKNAIDGKSQVGYDWRFTNLSLLHPLFKDQQKPDAVKPILMADTQAAVSASVVTAQSKVLLNFKGVNYTKGKNWYKNYHIFNMRVVQNDFADLKEDGLDGIRWYGLGLYDRDVLRAAAEQNIKVNYSFWIDNQLNFENDNQWLLDKIVDKINTLKNDKNIVAWNIGNTWLQNANLQYYKPQLFYQRAGYVVWLQKLVLAIKKADPGRPVSVDVEASDDLLQTINLFNSGVPQIDAFGIIVNETSTGASLIAKIRSPWFFSKVGGADYLRLGAKPGFFIANWQDEETADFLTFDGLKDKWGRNKFEYYALKHQLKGVAVPVRLPQVKVLLPALTTFANADIGYHALIFKNNRWTLATPADGLQFKWELVKNDQYGNPISAKALGTGVAVTVDIPDNPDDYRLTLYVSKGNLVNIVRSKLNTPLTP